MVALMLTGAAFLRENRMGRERAVDGLDDGGFGFLVSLGHQIERVALAGGLGAIEPAQMNPSGGACGAQRDLFDSIHGHARYSSDAVGSSSITSAGVRRAR